MLVKKILVYWLRNCLCVLYKVIYVKQPTWELHNEGRNAKKRSHWVEVDREEFMNLVELKRQVNLNAWGEEGKRQNWPERGNVAIDANPDMCQMCSMVDQD